MDYDQDLSKLEQNVEKLLGNLDSALDGSVKLKAEIARLEDEKRALEDEVKSLKEEKKKIHERVSGLIGAIEKWEKAAATTPASSKVEAKDSGDSPVTGGSSQPDPVQGVLVGN